MNPALTSVLFGRRGWVPGMVSQHDYRFLTYSDTGGTTPTSSGSVAAWGDLITGQLHTQGTAAAQPTLGASGLSFDGGDALSLSSPTGYPTGAGPVTMYAFAVPATVGGSMSLSLFGANTTRQAFGAGFANSTTARVTSLNDDLTFSTPSLNGSGIAFVCRTSGSVIYGNCLGALGSKSLGGTLNIVANASVFGANLAANAVFYNGLILGRIIYPVYHTAAQVNQNLRMAQREYGIPYYPVSA